jgi:hypothetical protein
MKINTELYKDPRWQKRRLEVFERDGWCCSICPNNDLTLHAHHLYYEEGLKPWEYPLEAIVTLCESCHEGEHEDLFIMEKELTLVFKKNGYKSFDFEMLSGCLKDHPEIIKWLDRKVSKWMKEPSKK